MRRPSFVIALFAAVAVTFLATRFYMAPRCPSVVVLKQGRCGDCNGVKGASVLLIDVREFSETASFDVALVDGAGRIIDHNNPASPSLRTLAYVCPPLPSGRYYLRLHENGTLRREFAISSE